MNLALRVVLPSHPHQCAAQKAVKAQADEAAESSVLFHQSIVVLRAEALDKVALYAEQQPAKA